MPAIPKHNTAVAEGTWDAGANVGRISADAKADVLRKEYAWVDPKKDPDTKSAYKFPHHFVSTDGKPGAASLSGVRNALARLPDSKIPPGDKTGVKAHLEAHLNAAKKGIEDALRECGGIVTKGDGLRLKGIRAETREADFIASTDAVDAHGEVIDQSSWQLNQYQLNPIVLYGHNSRDLPIGKATGVGVRGGRLEATIQFASADANPMAEQVWRLVQEGILRAVSVGFMPTDGKYEVRDGEDVFVWYAPVLKEISVVPVPANYEALAKMKAAFRAVADDDDADRAPAADSEEPNPEDETMGDTNTTETKGTDATAQKIGELNIKLVEVEQRADKAEARATLAEKALEGAQAQVKKLEDAAKVLESEHAKACADRDAATKRADEADAKLVEVEVEALVGVKIEPSEKADFVELRKSNPALFKSMVDKRADMKLTARVVKADPKQDDPSPGGSGAANDAVQAFNAL